MRFKIQSLYSLIILIFCIGLLSSSNALAATPTDIITRVSPENPKPYENTTINLSSYAYNVDTVMIAWFIDGRSISSGIGKKSFSLTTGAAGSTTVVTAKMDFPDGATEIRVLLRPATMTMLWEATDSYIPPFYKGKALPPLEGSIKVVALPEVKSGGQYMDAKKMNYVWRKDYSNNKNASGYGKNFFLYTNDYLDGLNNIEVLVSSVDGNYSSAEDITIGTYTPQISFYKKSGTLGTLWEKTIENGYQINTEEILFAAPYFIIPKQIGVPTLLFNWSINGNPIFVENFRKSVLPLKVEAGATGASQLRLDIESADKIFQTVSKEILIQF